MHYYILLGVHVLRPSSDSQWQRPEISSNLAEDLSLNDPIDLDLLPTQQEERSRRWKDIHSGLNYSGPVDHLQPYC